MMKITVIALASLKEKYMRDAGIEYEKRLSRYCKLKIIEIEPVRLPEKPSEAEISAALKREAELIIKKVPSGSLKIAACIEGKQFSSEEFAQKLNSAAMQSGAVTFIIGSSYGLSKEVKDSADIRMSVSKMTFPHQFFRIMLLEQIYRGFKINEGGTYHK